jgi:hypothetical protein
MKDLKEIRFVATNFYNLQGLKAVPLGAMLVFVSLWANELRGQASNLGPPLLGVAAFSILLFAIDRFYMHTFGLVRRTPESLRLEWLVSIVFGILALGAFWLETSAKLPVSALGLVFALGLLTDYVRITWLVRGRFLLYYPLGALLMAGVSVLPLFSVSNWWQVFGLKNQLIGITTFVGMFTIIAGIWGHIFLVRTLPSRRIQNDHTI